MAIVAETGHVTRLLEQVRDGDEQARTAVIEYAADRLRALATRMLRTNQLRRWEQTDDLLQQTLVRLHRHLSECQVTTTAAFLSYAALEMRHALIDLIRHYFGPHGIGTHYDTVEAQILASSTPRCEPSDPAPTPSQQAATVERWERLYQAIEELPLETRVAVDLVWFHGLTQAEGAPLGISERTLARRWRRARVDLFESLAGELPGM